MKGKRVTRNSAKAAANLEQHTYNDQQEQLQNILGSGDRRDKGESVVLGRPPIRPVGKDGDDGSDYDTKGNFKEDPKRPLFTKEEQEEEEEEEKTNSRQQRDHINATLDFEKPTHNRFSDVGDETKVLSQQRGAVKSQEDVIRRHLATDEDERKLRYRQQQRDEDERKLPYRQQQRDEDERKLRYRQQQRDPVNSTLNFGTGHQTSFSDDEDERNLPYRQQQREKRRVTQNNPGVAPQDCTNNIGKYLLLLLVVLGALAAFALSSLILEKQDTHKVDFQVMKDFYDGFRKLQINFTSQSQALWSRSQRVLELHLLNKDNKQPAILLLTAAQDAKQTLHCVGNKLAKTYASSLNSSYTVISGPDRKSEDSEDVKEEIDNKLSAGFQGTARAAVLHRLELLPPGSLLILYKYCDHENANFKNVALVLTVLLEDSTLKPDIQLGDLEEKVRDFFGKTFIVSGSKKSHNEMDVDKLSGVWSRISHVVLPVFPEKNIGKQCEETETEV